jgi:UDP-N-acetylglucosamine--dolichyl-phosphate N-acetylglucosaminephosphotransferase
MIKQHVVEWDLMTMSFQCEKRGKVSTYSTIQIMDYVLAALPLVPSALCLPYLHNSDTWGVILWSSVISVLGFLLTNELIPIFAQYTLKRGLCGKDLGKRGTPNESKDIPEALGIVCGIVFLVCTISSQLLFAKNEKQMIVYNSALFSICFMIFLGFLDDTLDLKWRYKLILPTVASLPLLLSYSGNTAMYIPKPFTTIFMADGSLTTIGSIVNVFATVDTEAHGAIIELGPWFLLFMGLQAVFCTNAINIFAGINGLECGQSYIIACSLLFFKMYEISFIHESGENERFALLTILPFIGTALGLLRHNWYPSSVFVGDTFCYFAGMTFAVIGIHSHFSKTLLMLFIPQIANFLYSIPQLFKLMPCPRHRLPSIDPKTKLMVHSTFPCKAEEFRMFKVHRDDTVCPNCTVICAVLRVTGPLSERTLCIVLLCLQVCCSALAFWVRYFVLE